MQSNIRALAAMARTMQKIGDRGLGGRAQAPRGLMQLLNERLPAELQDEPSSLSSSPPTYHQHDDDNDARQRRIRQSVVTMSTARGSSQQEQYEYQHRHRHPQAPQQRHQQQPPSARRYGPSEGGTIGSPRRTQPSRRSEHSMQPSVRAPPPPHASPHLRSPSRHSPHLQRSPSHQGGGSPPRLVGAASSDEIVDHLRAVLTQNLTRTLDLFRQWDTDNSGSISERCASHRCRTRNGFHPFHLDSTRRDLTRLDAT